MARDKALAMRDYMRKPAEERSTPTKRITPEPVVSSSQETESRPPATDVQFPLLMADIPNYIDWQMEEYGLTREGIYASYRQRLSEEPEPEPISEEEFEEEADRATPRIQQSKRDLDTFGSKDNPIYWEPFRVPNVRRQYPGDAEVLREVFEILSVDDDIIKPLYEIGHAEAVKKVIKPAIWGPSDYLMAYPHSCINGNSRNRLQNGINALAFYRHHSPQLDPHLTHAEVDFFEGMCNFLLCFIRNSGYSITHTNRQ
jgi:hypothetical protein